MNYLLFPRTGKNRELKKKIISEKLAQVTVFHYLYKSYM